MIAGEFWMRSAIALLSVSICAFSFSNPPGLTLIFRSSKVSTAAGILSPSDAAGFNALFMDRSASPRRPDEAADLAAATGGSDGARSSTAAPGFAPNSIGNDCRGSAKRWNLGKNVGRLAACCLPQLRQLFERIADDLRRSLPADRSRSVGKFAFERTHHVSRFPV